MRSTRSSAINSASGSSGTLASREHDDVPADSASGARPQAAAAWDAVLGWLCDAQQEGPGPEVQHAAGYMKWGFVHAFRWVGRTTLLESRYYASETPVELQA
jgi:hypothetical protein